MKWDKTRRICGNCDFWAVSKYSHEWPFGFYGPQNDGTRSDCRFQPPVVHPKQDAWDPQSVWPITNREQWCGKFKKRPS